jgi:hypothetical protein
MTQEASLKRPVSIPFPNHCEYYNNGLKVRFSQRSQLGWLERIKKGGSPLRPALPHERALGLSGLGDYSTYRKNRRIKSPLVTSAAPKPIVSSETTS